MLFGEAGSTARGLAEKLLLELRSELGDDFNKPPCSYGNRTLWTRALIAVLSKMGCGLEYKTYPWLLDYVWWCNKTERMVLAVESELDPCSGLIEDDFQKLPSFKCPLKLFVFSTKDTEGVKQMAEGYLRCFGQHVKDEEYVLLDFTGTGPRCFWFRVPSDGALATVIFKEFGRGIPEPEQTFSNQRNQ